jgi:glyoxylase-like metal-dependent hydrolase (beta-lactamase superfamily II)
MSVLWLGLATFTLLGIYGSGVQAAPQPYKFIEGRLSADVQPDGNTVIFEGSEELVVIDTGRHPEHSDKILAYAKERGKPVTAIINTHWHLDHSSGNARIRAVYPRAKLYASAAVVGALKGFLIRNAPRSREQLADPATPEARKAAIRIYLGAIDDPVNLIPDMPVTGRTTLTLADRTLELHLMKHAATEGDVWIYDQVTSTVIVGDLVVVPLPFFDTACAEGWQRALNDLEKIPFKTLIPGHGRPMPRSDFNVYRLAFDKLVNCAQSNDPTAACVSGWMKDAAKFVATYPDRKDAEDSITYYIDQIIRSREKQREFCRR